jgi:hypothetical protein
MSSKTKKLGDHQIKADAGPDATEPPKRKQLPWANLDDYFNKEPAPLEFILPGYLTGTVGGLVSQGGLGKSTIIIQAAMGVACPEANLLGIDIGKHGRVAILAAEDPDESLHHRFFKMSRHFNPEVRQILKENLRVSPCVGHGVDLMSDEWQDTIEEAATGAVLLVMDTLTRFHGLNENDGADAKAIMSKMEGIATRTGASILYLHHVNKSAAMNGMTDLQQAARGSSVFVDNARWLSFVAGMSEDEAKKSSIQNDDRRNYLRFNISKQNYGPPIKDCWFKRGDGGVLLPVDFDDAKPKRAAKKEVQHDKA